VSFHTPGKTIMSIVKDFQEEYGFKQASWTLFEQSNLSQVFHLGWNCYVVQKDDKFFAVASERRLASDTSILGPGGTFLF